MKGKVHVYRDNIDTDRIIPGKYTKTLDTSQLARHVLEDLDPTFPERVQKGDILVAGHNFGCGSSREHAPWALLDFGVKCVISTSFADIFYNNCFKNGILPAIVSPEDLDKLMDDAKRGANATLTVDLESQTISGPDGGEVKFEIDEMRKQRLLEGIDDIGETLTKAPKIDSFEKKIEAERPWI